MYISRKLRNENIAEYLLYMWQVEDRLRSFHMDTTALSKAYLSLFSDLTPEQKQEQEEWYSQLADMMRSEGITQQGHLQINKNIILELTELHSQFIASENFPLFRSAYYNALPAIVELRSKSGNAEIGEIEVCFNLLYGIMLLRISNKTISQETEEGKEKIARYIGLLAEYYNENRRSPLMFD